MSIPEKMQGKNPNPEAGVQVSVVMPCLNEEESIAFCINMIKTCFVRYGIKGEIIVVDNDSTDNSLSIAKANGAKVVVEQERGYGNAYKTGIAIAQGRYIIMGDSDGTYDFSMIGDFVEALRQGAAFVTGSRKLGEIRRGSMPWFHQYFGNPMLTKLLNFLFHSEYTDVYCGLRGFTKEAYDLIRPISSGMEFNLELAINAAKAKLEICEIPITLSPRVGGKSKLSTFSDGWRSLRFMLLYFPGRLFFIPGLALFIFGMVFLIGLFFADMGMSGKGTKPIIMLAGSIMTIIGVHIFSLGLYAKTFATIRKYEQENRFLKKFYRFLDLGKGMFIGLTTFSIGFGICVYLLIGWINRGFTSGANLDLSLIALTLLSIGVQMMFSSIYVSLLSLERGGGKGTKFSETNGDHGAMDISGFHGRKRM